MPRVSVMIYDCDGSGYALSLDFCRCSISWMEYTFGLSLDLILNRFACVADVYCIIRSTLPC